ncbi:hypothetical protein LG314_11770 [Agrococcus terreus]|uniref:hypothetical protein n=1 Tax=Agrococcus terreus TaxID=574649 RepID=UPI00385169BE
MTRVDLLVDDRAWMRLPVLPASAEDDRTAVAAAVSRGLGEDQVRAALELRRPGAQFELLLQEPGLAAPTVVHAWVGAVDGLGGDDLEAMVRPLGPTLVEPEVQAYELEGRRAARAVWALHGALADGTAATAWSLAVALEGGVAIFVSEPSAPATTTALIARGDALAASLELVA